MKTIKLADWAQKTGVKYLTAWRWFNDGQIPGAYKTSSGTILVPEEVEEQNMANTPNEAMSLFLKKTVEFSKNQSSVEDFAAFVIANFQLKLNGSDTPRYSKNKPKPEDVQKHFQKFLPDQKNLDHLKAVKTLLKEGKAAGDVIPAANDAFSATVDNMNQLFEEVELAEENTDVHMYGHAPVTDGLVTRSVDLNTTPQQINYTGSNSQTISSGDLSTLGGSGPSAFVMTNSVEPLVIGQDLSLGITNIAESYFNSQQSPFQPTQKELLSANKVIETVETQNLPRRRGRKPSKKR